MAALQGAVESTAPVSRLHEHQSFSLDDFPVPTGREEEWRFTPLRRLRGLHNSPASGGKVTVGADARAAVVLDHAGSATYADNVEIVVGDGASLTVVSLQDWDDDAVHVSRHYAVLGRDARLQHTAVTLGGGVVRLAPSVRYAG